MIPFNHDTDFLALDFDGVIADSIEECLVMGYNAFALHNKNYKPINHLSELDSNIISEVKKLRNFIRSGQDYVYIFKALNLAVQIKDQADFDEFTSKYQDDHDLYFELFYHMRAKLSESDPEAWAKLSPLYSGIQAFLSSFPKERLYIVTTKKIEYASIILKLNRIVLPAEHMCRATGEIPKQTILSQLVDRLDVQPVNFHFIDDQVDTLVKVKPTGVQCYMAEWGYNNQDQICQARAYEIPVLSLTTFLNGF
ncbi:hypothetical protein HQ585_04275 [candidate division KSB1 bacterium]|nr:hypothetical protein [candidate division KSB1 bacterium]